MNRNTALWRTILAGALVLTLAVVLAACGKPVSGSLSADVADSTSETAAAGAAQTDDTAQDEPDSTEATQPADEEAASASGDAAEETGSYAYTVMLSYANYDYIETGDDNEPKLIRNVQTNIETEDDSLETLMKDIILALRTVPDGIEKAETLVSDRYPINGVSLESGTAIVDINGDSVEDGSQFDEQFFIYQIADSILHSVSGVDTVQFVIDGAQEKEFVYMDLNKAYSIADCNAFAE